MCTGAGFHGNHAAGGQLAAPDYELVARQGASREHPPSGIDGVNLDHALGQIGAYANGYTFGNTSCNLLHGLPLSMAFRLMTLNTTNLGAPTPLPEGGKSLRIPIERTRNGMPRMAFISFWAMRVLPLRAAHVKR
jgi:hypothetical protein